jgi:hypothetical protein
LLPPPGSALSVPILPAAISSGHFIFPAASGRRSGATASQCFAPAARSGCRSLHDGILEPALGITLQAATKEMNLTSEREANAAIAAVDSGRAQVSFLLNPVDVEKVVEIATSNEVMPQKSTDFYPKLLSGITMYRV